MATTCGVSGVLWCLETDRFAAVVLLMAGQEKTQPFYSTYLPTHAPTFCLLLYPGLMSIILVENVQDSGAKQGRPLRGG
jgi:hypothetical protein